MGPEILHRPPRGCNRRCLALLVALGAAGCDPSGAPQPPDAARDAAPSLASAPGYDPEWRPKRRAPPGGDPLGGRFELAAATEGLPPGQRLVATIDTSAGSLRCELWPHRAPRTVANFVGLARGIRPYKTTSGWRRQRAYDGSSFYRVLPGVGIVGGRPVAGARDAPGYHLADERWPGMTHDRAGLLCTRGRGRDRAGAEFLITAAAAPSLDGQDGGAARPGFTVFGACEPEALIADMAASGDEHGRPRTHLAIHAVRIERLGTDVAGAGSAHAADPRTDSGPEGPP